MKRLISSRTAPTFGMTAIAGAAVMLGCTAAAQETGAHPDLRGVWEKSKIPSEGLNSPPLTPEGQKAYARTKAGVLSSDPEIDLVLRCIPTGFPRTALDALPAYISQDSTLVAILGEASKNLPQMIWMNAKHRDLWPTYMGDSVGHWEGDTLVVDTVSVKSTTFYNAEGLPHSDAFHSVERLRLINGGKQLENRITFEDPKYLARPWQVRMVYDRNNADRPIENVCDTSRLAP